MPSLPTSTSVGTGSNLYRWPAQSGIPLASANSWLTRSGCGGRSDSSDT